MQRDDDRTILSGEEDLDLPDELIESLARFDRAVAVLSPDADRRIAEAARTQFGQRPRRAPWPPASWRWTVPLGNYERPVLQAPALPDPVACRMARPVPRGCSEGPVRRPRRPPGIRATLGRVAVRAVGSRRSDARGGRREW